MVLFILALLFVAVLVRTILEDEYFFPVRRSLDPTDYDEVENRVAAANEEYGLQFTLEPKEEGFYVISAQNESLGRFHENCDLMYAVVDPTYSRLIYCRLVNPSRDYEQLEERIGIDGGHNESEESEGISDRRYSGSVSIEQMLDSDSFVDSAGYEIVTTTRDIPLSAMALRIGMKPLFAVSSTVYYVIACAAVAALACTVGVIGGFLLDTLRIH